VTLVHAGSEAGAEPDRRGRGQQFAENLGGFGRAGSAVLFGRIYPRPTEHDRRVDTVVAGGRYELYSNYPLEIQAVAASATAKATTP
jgi:hypothetical protein